MTPDEELRVLRAQVCAARALALHAWVFFVSHSTDAEHPHSKRLDVALNRAHDVGLFNSLDVPPPIPPEYQPSDSAHGECKVLGCVCKGFP